MDKKLEALRDAARAINRPNWRAANGHVTADETDELPSMDIKCLHGNREDGKRLARYIALANPAAILALVERVAAMDDALDFEPDARHSVADMANVGYSLMQAIMMHRPDYAWNESPAEIVGDLIEELSIPPTGADHD